MNTPDLDLRELRALNARFIQNFVSNDVASHDAITHPRFVYISSAGARVGRAEYLRAWASGFDPQVIVYWDLRDESIDVFGDVALVRAANRHVQRRGGQDLVGMSAYTDTYVRERGRWWCVQAQITTVAPAHWPGDETVIARYVQGRLQPRDGVGA
jgi:ketosteroid isomerase-like protein